MFWFVTFQIVVRFIFSLTILKFHIIMHIFVWFDIVSPFVSPMKNRTTYCWWKMFEIFRFSDFQIFRFLIYFFFIVFKLLLINGFVNQRATYKLHRSDLQATYKRYTRTLHVTYTWPTRDLHVTYMRTDSEILRFSDFQIFRFSDFQISNRFFF